MSVSGRTLAVTVAGGAIALLVWLLAFPAGPPGPGTVAPAPATPETPPTAPAAVPTLTRSEDEPAEEVAAEAEARIRGRIVDEEGRPVADAEVSWFRGERVRTDHDGNFEILAPEGKTRTHLTVRHPRFRELRSHVPSSASGLELELDSGLAISGRVTAAGGDGVEGIWIRVGGRAARTDGRGFYRVEGLEPGEHTVVCREPRYGFTTADPPEGPGARRWTHSAPAGAHNVDFGLAGRPLEVRVRDEEGHPIPGARVVARADGSHPVRQGQTEEDGRALTVTAWGPLALSASAPGYEPAGADLEPEAWEKRILWEVVLKRTRDPAALRVSARDRDRRPYERVFVSLLDPAGRPLAGHRDLLVALDDRGEGRLTDLPAGRFAARISDAPYPPSVSGYGLPSRVELDLHPGETSRIDVEIPRGGRIRVTVRDRTGKIVRPGQVVISRTDGKKMAPLTFGTASGDGFERAGSRPVPVLSLAPLEPGEYLVTARFGRRREAWLRSVATVVAGETTELELCVPEDGGER